MCSSHVRCADVKSASSRELVAVESSLPLTVIAVLPNLRHRLTALEAFQVFVGPKGGRAELHNANQCNLFTQVYGVKRWSLIPNYYAPVIDPPPIQTAYRSASQPGVGVFDPFNPVYDGPFEAYRYIDRFEAELQPGDVMWVPPLFWHAVQNETDSIGVGYRWLAPFYSFKKSPLYSLLDACVRKPNILDVYKLYAEDATLLLLAESGDLDEYLKHRDQLEAQAA